jgi:hypothetical protein
MVAAPHKFQVTPSISKQRRNVAPFGHFLRGQRIHGRAVKNGLRSSQVQEIVIPWFLVYVERHFVVVRVE